MLQRSEGYGAKFLNNNPAGKEHDMDKFPPPNADTAHITSVNERLTVMIETEMKPMSRNPASPETTDTPASKPDPAPELSKSEPSKKATVHPPLPLILPRHRTTFTPAGTLADIVDHSTACDVPAAPGPSWPFVGSRQVHQE